MVVQRKSHYRAGLAFSSGFRKSTQDMKITIKRSSIGNTGEMLEINVVISQIKSSVKVSPIEWVTSRTEYKHLKRR